MGILIRQIRSMPFEPSLHAMDSFRDVQFVHTSLARDATEE